MTERQIDQDSKQERDYESIRERDLKRGGREEGVQGEKKRPRGGKEDRS